MVDVVNVSFTTFSKPVAILVLTGAIGSIFLCLSLSVFAIVVLCRRKRSPPITPFPIAPVRAQAVVPRVVQKPLPKAPPSSSAGHSTASRKTKRPPKPDFTVQPYPLQPQPSMGTMNSQQRTRFSGDSLQFSRPQSNSKDSVDFTPAFQVNLRRRSSVDPVVALELGERGSPDMRSLEARPSSSTYAEERMLAKVERFRDLPLSEWNAGSSLQR